MNHIGAIARLGHGKGWRATVLERRREAENDQIMNVVVSNDGNDIPANAIPEVQGAPVHGLHNVTARHQFSATQSDASSGRMQECVGLLLADERQVYAELQLLNRYLVGQRSFSGCQLR